MSWPTGESLSSALVAVRFLVPANQWAYSSVNGAVQYLANAASWDEEGTCTPAQAAAAFDFMCRTVTVEAVTVGQIVCFPADNMEWINRDPSQGASQWLKCEGQSLSVIAYPELYSIVGNTFGGDTTAFNLPDLRGRTIVDAGAGPGLTDYPLATVFGEETHQLTVSELASHVHSYVPQGAAEPLEVGAGVGSTPNVIPTSTGSAGGDTAHENRQPSMALFYYIQVKP